MRKPALLITLLLLLLTACGLFGSSEDNDPDIPGKIVFAAEDENGNSQIYKINGDGSELQQLTDLEDGHEAYEPSWSPDGTQIVFSTSLRSSSNGLSLYLMDADGGNMRPLHERENSHIPTPGSYPTWSSDGTKIAWHQCVNCQLGTNYELFTYDVATDSVTRLTDNHTSETHPTWSPDGRQIIFVSNRDYPENGGYDLYLMKLESGSIERLTETGNAGRPVWNIENQLIYWSNNSLYQMNMNTRESKLITVDFDQQLGYRPLSTSKGGKMILLQVFNQTNPPTNQTLQVVILPEKKLTKIYSSTSFNGADWYTPDQN